MSIMTKNKSFIFRLSIVLLFAGFGSFALLSGQSAHAAKYKKPSEQNWSFDGFFGTYDRASLQRGYQVFEQVCASCHGLDYVHFRNLEALGYSPEEVKAIAANYPVEVRDGPDERGQMFTRPARPTDSIPYPFANEAEAKFVNKVAPPDMSLIVSARYYGADYVHALLTGYQDPPEGVTVTEGLYYNPYFPGKNIAMAPPIIMDGQVEYKDGTEPTIEQMSKDVTHFLAWASDPHMESRKRMGLAVCLFLIVFSGLMYGVKKKLWKDLQ